MAEREESRSGQPIYRHSERTTPFEATHGDSGLIDAIGDHLETHLGKIDWVFHEVVSDLVHIDIHVSMATGERPWHALVTTGMSQKPMKTPEGMDGLAYAELLICLPSDWKLSQDDFEDERNYWPVRWLKMLARMPHEYDTWLGQNHTIPNGDPPEPFVAGTRLCCWMLNLPTLLPQEFHALALPDRTIRFYNLVPLYPEETKFKLDAGGDALNDLLDTAKVSDVIAVKRKSVCERKRY